MQQTMRTVGVVVMVITGLVCGGIVGMVAALQGYVRNTCKNQSQRRTGV